MQAGLDFTWMGFGDAALKRATEPPDLPSGLCGTPVGRMPTARQPVPRLSADKQVTERGSHHHTEAVKMFQTTKPFLLPFIDPASILYLTVSIDNS